MMRKSLNEKNILCFYEKSLRKTNKNVYLNSVNNGLLGGNNLVYSHLFNKERLYSSKVNKSKKYG